jgi:lupus La protein
MRHFQPLSAIIEALKSSETVELVDNDTKVRRKTALPESVNDSFDPNVVKVFEDEAMGRSVYAKGFGEEVPTTQFDIEAFFAPYGPTNAIRLRRSWDKIFKGSVFVEFDSEETQKKFLALDPKPKWKGQELLIKSKKDYCDEKVKDIEAGRIKPKSNGFRGRGRGRGGGRGGRGDNRDWRDRRNEDQKKGFQRGGRGNHRGWVRDEEPPKSNIKKDVRYVTSQTFFQMSTSLTIYCRGIPVVQSTAAEDKPASAGQKRAREEDGAQATGNGTPQDPPAKKVDVKEG